MRRKSIIGTAVIMAALATVVGCNNNQQNNVMMPPPGVMMPPPGGMMPPPGGMGRHGTYGDAGALDVNPVLIPAKPIESEPEIDLEKCITINLTDRTVSDDTYAQLEINDDEATIKPLLKDMCVRMTGAWNGKVELIDDASKSLGVVLDNVSITSQGKAAAKLSFSLTKKDNRVVNLKLEGANSIEGAANSDSKKVIDSDVSIHIFGTGSLDVKAHYKTGISVDDVLKIYNGTVRIELDRGEDVVWKKVKGTDEPDYEKGFAIKATNAFEMVGGALSIKALDSKIIEGYENRGIKVDGLEENYGAGRGYIDIKAGDLVIQSDGKAMSAGWERGEDARTETQTDDPMPDVRISGGRIRITTFAVARETMLPPPDMQARMDAEMLAKMKAQASQTPTLSPEGIEAKHSIYISGGELIVRAMDDAIQAAEHISISGGKIVAFSPGNDAIDSNGTIDISGGLTVAIGAREPECGLDADSSNNITYSGGVLIGLGGGNNAPGNLTASASFVQNADERERGMGRPGRGMPRNAMSEDEAIFDEEVEEAKKQQEEMKKAIQERMNRKSDYAGKIVALTAKGSNDVIAAIQVPENYKGGSNVLILSDKIAKDAEYALYKDAKLTLAQGASWFGGSLQAILDGAATVTGADPTPVTGGKAVSAHGPGGGMTRHSASCSCGGVRGGGPRPDGMGGPGGRQRPDHNTQPADMLQQNIK